MSLEKRNGIFGEYWGNDYNSSNALSLEQMKINATYIYNYFNSKGWTKNAIAGILGNMQSESSINPGRWEGNIVEGEPEKHGYGLVQWTPYTKYTKWVQGDPSTIDNNLSRIIYELENNLQWIATSQYNYSFREFTKSEDTPYNLAIAFLTNYERPANPVQPKRGEQAIFWFDFLGGVVPLTITKKNNFKWVIYAKKLRKRNNNH